MGTITVRGLGKAYRQYAKRSDRLLEWLMPFGGTRHKLRWVLTDIDFSVAPGRAVGVIGMNGAGKSTLLKLITGTVQPTSGSISIGGRVAALLELGLGFHAEFTGRQNAVMAAQLLGMSALEIEELMPGIEAFAELGSFIDQPVRMYSSGMQVRLAFSVATAIRPDVLIVDEALSVGDAYFQHKSFARIRAFREQGTTLLLVSHDKAAIQAICDEAILLHEGRLAMRGTPESVMDYYNGLIAEKEDRTVRQMQAGGMRMQTLSGTGEAVLKSVRLLDDQSRPIDTVSVGQTVTLELVADVRKNLDALVAGYMIKDRLGLPVFGTNTFHLGRQEASLSAGESLTARFTFEARLGEGTYSIAAALHDAGTHLGNNYEWRDLALVFQVINTDAPTFVGTAHLPPTLSIERMEAPHDHVA